MGIFSWLNKKESKEIIVILKTKLLEIINPTYKQVVEHIKGVSSEDVFIKLSSNKDASYLKASEGSHDDIKDESYFLEYYSKEKSKIYRLDRVDIEQTLCFFKDFLNMQKLIDFDLENNNWIVEDKMSD